tara:strand:- start:484 stop:708 length:225 start_codon:yes stop_codon:yes gene_type:complete
MKTTNKTTLDLHGVRHSDVDRLVENFVLLNDAPLTIMCGNSDKMIKLVRDTLDGLYESAGVSWQMWNHNTFKIL